ncbi:unnamed protein product [Arabis nemorensis]|uniref:TIR domain-containing protein n=1 Tax=Arabis nemorensis TaxID=586526 RepID=A0A565BRG6_9BRAS|nr:unnamed protein product [Arabis nemorensis]
MTISSPTQTHQVFFNYRGEQLRYNFISHLIDAFERHKIKFIIDIYEQRGKDLKDLFVRIEESRIALAIFSTRYAESSWCMDELVKMKKLADQGKLIVIPIFYKVKAKDVRGQEGEFGDNFWKLAKASSGDQIKKWKEALECISDKMGLSFRDKSSEADFVKKIVKEVQRVIAAIESEDDKNNFVVNGESLRIAISIVCLFKLNHQILGPRREPEEVVPGDPQEAWETFPPDHWGLFIS